MFNVILRPTLDVTLDAGLWITLDLERRTYGCV